jgi:hypothetical protein
MFGWRKTTAKKPASASPTPAAIKPAERQKHAHAEIHAYIAIRDRLFAEAEENPTISTLHRAWIANDVVEIFLKPARTPYEAQYLPETEAGEERQRCATVGARITELRSKIAIPSAGTAAPRGGKATFLGVKAVGTTPA